MTRVVSVLAVIAAVLTAVVGGGIWLLVRGRPTPRPEISAYSHGHLTRVGPYRYCEVLNLNDCENPRNQGELPISARYPVQLSVPTTIGDAPWLLRRVYQDSEVEAVTIFRPGARLAVTIPTVDPERGRLAGVVVQLLTLVLDPSGELAQVPHAEWSIRTVFS